MQSRLIQPAEVWDWEDDGPPRSGVHVSAIIQGIRETLGKARGRDDADDRRMGFIRAGTAFDAALGRAMDRALADTTPHRTHPLSFRPHSKCVDGIWGSPDRLVVDDGTGWRFRGPCPSPTVIEEHKLTWMTYDEDIGAEKYWFWVVQDKAYCYMFRTLRGRIRALFVNGNRRPPLPIDPVAWDLAYSPAELRDNWEMLRQFAEDQGWLGRGRRP